MAITARRALRHRASVVALTWAWIVPPPPKPLKVSVSIKKYVNKITNPSYVCRPRQDENRDQVHNSKPDQDETKQQHDQIPGALESLDLSIGFLEASPIRYGARLEKPPTIQVIQEDAGCSSNETANPARKKPRATAIGLT